MPIKVVYNDTTLSFTYNPLYTVSQIKREIGLKMSISDKCMILSLNGVEVDDAKNFNTLKYNPEKDFLVLTLRKFKLVKVPGAAAVERNCVFFCGSDYTKLGTPARVSIYGIVFNAEPHPSLGKGEIGIGKLHREFIEKIFPNSFPKTMGEVSLDDDVENYPVARFAMFSVTDSMSKEVSSAETSAAENAFKRSLMGGTSIPVCLSEPFVVTSTGKTYVVRFYAGFRDMYGTGLALTKFIVNYDTIFDRFSNESANADGGNSADTEMETDPDPEFVPVFKTDIDLKKLNIGGLDDQFVTMFRRAFASRSVKPDIAKRLGLKHVKGILLYGPPGCGKTLIARKMCECLNTVTPVIINGPELVNKYIGQSEENIRNLFAPAQKDQTSLGERSPLHVLIFDEFDSIVQHRGGGENARKDVNDGMVNQLLTMIDGVNSLNNILIIGMTNRKDLIDPAILRPGRLEIHIEIGLPDERGRRQILDIHTATLRQNKNISLDVDFDEIASSTKNYTGAELEGMVNNARTYALARAIDPSKLSDTTQVKGDEIIVTRDDFSRAIGETKAAFGSGTSAEIKKMVAPNVCVNENIAASIFRFLNESPKTKFRLLIQGDRETGKTSQAILSALEFDIPCIKYISPFSFIGVHSLELPSQIKKIISEATITPLSAVIIDDYDTLIGYNESNGQFSNDMVQTINALFKNTYTTNKIIFIVVCSKEKERLSAIEKMNTFRMFDETFVL
jgi:SpoVK/Ycf46/Vps4 family AAA+-type ATPase